MAVVEGTTLKAVASVTGAGLIATISRDPDFLVLFGSAVLISSASYTYDLHRAPTKSRYIVHFVTWIKYVMAGLAVMFLSFNGLITWVHTDYQLPHTAWYFVSITLAGYGIQILDKIKEFSTPILEKLIGKSLK